MIIERFAGSVEAIAPMIKEYKQAIQEEPLGAAQYIDLQNAANAGDIAFFVAKDGDIPVAMCSISKTFSTYHCSYSGVFEDFYVSPAYRKSGLAGMLTDYVFSYCRSSGIKSLWVGCAQCDAAMYRHLGFEIPLGYLLTWSAE